MFHVKQFSLSISIILKIIVAQTVSNVRNEKINRPIKDNEITSRRLDGGRYVVFLIKHTAEAIQQAWAECFSELAKRQYTLDFSRPIIERYAKKLVEQHNCELCVPVL